MNIDADYQYPFRRVLSPRRDPGLTAPHMRADFAGSLAPIPTEDLEYGYLGRNV